MTKAHVSVSYVIGIMRRSGTNRHSWQGRGNMDITGLKPAAKRATLRAVCLVKEMDVGVRNTDDLGAACG